MSATILEVWGRTDDQKKTEARGLALERLQAGASLYLTEAKSAVMDKQAALTAAIMASERNPSFSSIVDARVELKKAQLVLAAAQEAFAEFFGS